MFIYEFHWKVIILQTVMNIRRRGQMIRGTNNHLSLIINDWNFHLVWKMEVQISWPSAASASGFLDRTKQDVPTEILIPEASVILDSTQLALEEFRCCSFISSRPARNTGHLLFPYQLPITFVPFEHRPVWRQPRPSVRSFPPWQVYLTQKRMRFRLALSSRQEKSCTPPWGRVVPLPAAFWCFLSTFTCHRAGFLRTFDHLLAARCSRMLHASIHLPRIDNYEVETWLSNVYRASRGFWHSHPAIVHNIWYIVP